MGVLNTPAPSEKIQKMYTTNMVGPKLLGPHTYIFFR